MSELKCPFCQQELGRKNINDRMCSNEKCVSWKGNFYGSEDLWQELICTRKALELAITGLKNCKTRDHIGAVCRTPEYVDKILGQINTIIKGDQQ